MALLGWIIFFAPLAVAALIAFFLLKKPQLAGWLATGIMAVCFVLSYILCLTSGAFRTTGLESSFSWIPLGNFSVEFGILLNGLTILMLLIVTGIGSLIFLYSTTYMEHDESFARYFASLSLFAFSMLGIVLSNNLIQVFIFWELVGLSSYLLIGFWYQKPEASTAGKKAFLTTRVGDVGMMIGILLLFGLFAKAGAPSFNFKALEQNLANVAIEPNMMTAIALLIFMGVMGKSAQMPLHVWLPDAMEGPTPVSALIHAATMVAAGVFLLARLFFLFSASPQALSIIAWTGGITAFLAGTIAIVQNDIKKILAYSTLSQLGYMVLALGLHSPEAGMFHLATHAFFKALLFLGAGSFIHGLHTQNIFEMPTSKGLFKEMPITSGTFMIGTLALMGIPPLSGYFSKEEVLSAASHGPKILFYLALATVFCTAFYMGRLCIIIFPKKSGSHTHGHESGWKMSFPLLVLAALSIVGGFLPLQKFLGASAFHPEGPVYLKWLSIGLAAAGFLFALVFYQKAKSIEKQTGLLGVLEKKYFFDEFYDRVVIQGIQENIAKFSDFFERVVVIEAGVNGTARVTRYLGDFLRKFQTGVVQFYALIFAAAVTTLIYCLILLGQI